MKYSSGFLEEFQGPVQFGGKKKNKILFKTHAENDLIQDKFDKLRKIVIFATYLICV